MFYKIILKLILLLLINVRLKYFFLQVSTTENLAIFIWDQLQKVMEKPQLLHEVKILETEKNHVVYRGGSTYPRKKLDNSSLHPYNQHNVSSDSD